MPATGGEEVTNGRRWIFVCLLLVAVAALHRFCFDGMRSLVALSDFDDRWLVTATSSAPLAGGALALVVGARMTLCAGTLSLALSSALLALLSPASPAAVACFALGHGLLLPAIYAIAGNRFGPPGRAARLSLFAALFVASQLAAVAAPSAADTVVAAMRSEPMFLASMRSELASLAFLLPGGVLIVVAAILVSLLSPESPAAASEGERGPRLVGLSILAGGSLWFWFTYTAGWTWFQPRLDEWRVAGVELDWYEYLSPGLLVALGLMMAWSFARAHRSGARIPTTGTLVVCALVAATVGLVLRLTVGPTVFDEWWRFAATVMQWRICAVAVLLAAAELLLLPLFEAATSDLGERLGTLVVALLIVVTTGELTSELAVSVGRAGGFALWRLVLVGILLVAALWWGRGRIAELLQEGSSGNGSSA